MALKTKQNFQDKIIGFKEAFSLFDNEGNGTITHEDLYTVLRSLAINISKNDLQERKKELKILEKEFISIYDFILLMELLDKNDDNEDKLINAVPLKY